MKLMKTWVKGLDETLGGLPSKSVILLMGEPGSCHDLLAQQILYLHALKGGKSAYFTTFRSDTVVREDFSNYGWKLKKLEKAKQWEFVDLHAVKNSQAFRKKIFSEIQKKHWTLIDSFSHLLMRHKPEQAFGIVETLLEGSRMHGGVHLMILTKGMHDSQTEIGVQEFVDGCLEFVLHSSS
jgi:KaiC/GvpD/RAD55 family RecA-like ATPase